MAYRIALTKNFLREYRKLPSEVKNRVLRAIDEIATNPFMGIRLRGELEGYRRWRIGKYRIIYMINQKSKLVVLLDIGPRKTIYK